MKLLILFITLFYTLFLNISVFGQDHVSQSSCPFVLFHLIKSEGLGFYYTYTAVKEVHYYLGYGVDPDPDLDGKCFDPYYQSLPKGSTLLHVLAHSSIDEHEKAFISKALVIHGANSFIEDENGDKATDIDPCLASLYFSHTFERQFFCKPPPIKGMLSR